MTAFFLVVSLPMSELLLVSCRDAHSEVSRIPIERFEDDDDRLRVTVPLETSSISTELRWKHVFKKRRKLHGR